MILQSVCCKSVPIAGVSESQSLHKYRYAVGGMGGVGGEIPLVREIAEYCNQTYVRMLAILLQWILPEIPCFGVYHLWSYAGTYAGYI